MGSLRLALRALQTLQLWRTPAATFAAYHGPLVGRLHPSEVYFDGLVGVYRLQQQQLCLHGCVPSLQCGVTTRGLAPHL